MAIRDADIKLLFGVATGGADGDSAALIKQQLEEIMSKIKIGVTLKTSDFHTQIKRGLKAANDKGSFVVNISEIKIGSGAISAFKKKLSDIISTLTLDKGVSISLSGKEIDKVAGSTKEIKRQTEEAARAAAEFKVQMAAIDDRSRSIRASLKSVGGSATTSEQSDIAAIQAQYDAWLVKMETARGMKTGWNPTQRAAILEEAAAIQESINALIEQQKVRMDAAAAAEAEEKATREAAAATKEKAKADTAAAAIEKKKNTLMSNSYGLLGKMKNAIEGWTAASDGKSKESYDGIKRLIAKLTEAMGTVDNTEASIESFRKTFNGINTDFKIYSARIKDANENTKTFGERVKGLADKFTSWLTVSQIIMLMYRSVQNMVRYVVDIDTAMTELRKVTDETSGTYIRFLDEAAVRAKKLGATIADTVNASADFARLGYTLSESAQLADAALVYKNVGDGIENIGEASESIISTMKAFNIEAGKSIEIVDKFNEVGNRFPISSQGIGEALQRSASALAAGNNSLEESIALITAANSVVQNPEVVGTSMKTLSMYLRAAKTEAEEAGESTDGMANSVSELRDEILALTGNKVDIQLDENTFKSTYQIMKELSYVWEELTDISRANILEQIAGKRNANVVSSLLENFELAEGALETAANAAGSAMAENEKYLDSIHGKVAEFKATFEQLASTLIGSDFVKQIVDMGTVLLNVLNVAAKLVDTVGGLNTVLVATLGTIVSIKRKAIFEKLEKVKASLSSFKELVSIYDAAFISAKKLSSASGMVRSSLSGLKAGINAVAASAYNAEAAFSALTIVMTVISLTLKAYKGWKQALEDQRAAAKEAAEAYTDASNSIQEYKTRVTELRTAIDSGVISEQSAYNKRKELLDIQKKLVDSYGQEAREIDLVTGSINGQIDALDKLAKKKWEQEQQENSRAISAATSLFTEFSFKKLDMWGGTDQFPIAAPTSGELWNAIKKSGIDMLPRDFHDELQKRIDDAGLDIKIPITGITGDFVTDADIDNIYDALQLYRDYYDILSNTGKDLFGGNYLDYIGDALGRVSDRITSINGAIQDNEAIFNSYAQGILSYDKEYSGLWGKILAAQSEYNDAILSGDETAILSAIEKMKSVQDAFLSAGWDNEAVNLYVSKIFDDFNAAAKSQNFEIEVKAKLSDDTNEFGRQIKDALKEFEDEAGKIDAAHILNVGLNKDGAAANEVAAYNSLRDAAAEYGMEVEDLCNVLTKLGYIQGTIEATFSNPLDFSELTTSLDSAKDGLDGIISAMDRLRNGTAMTKQELANLALQYPKLLEESQLFTDNSIEGQKRILDTILDVKEKEYDAYIDEKIAELSAAEEAINEQIELETQKEQIILDIKNMSVNGRIEQEDELNKKLSELRDLEGQNYVEMENGILTVTNQALNEKERQDVQYKDMTLQEAWQPLGNGIEKAHTVGLSNGLVAMDTFRGRLRAKVSSIISGPLKALSLAFNKASSGKDPTSALSINTSAGSGGSNIISSSGVNLLVPVVRSRTTIDNLGVDEWVSKQQEASALRIESLRDLQQRTVNARKNLEALKGLDLTSIYGSAGSGGGGKGNGGSGSSKDTIKTIEEYIADIDKYYEAVKRLQAAQEKSASLAKKIKYADDTAEKIKLSSDLVNAYREEMDAERNLMGLKRDTIDANAAALRSLGFQVDYNRESNELLIRNQEHLNELTATSAGKYGTLQEATNALRKETESLISATEKLNNDNIDAATSIEDLGYQIKDTKNNIIDYIESVYDKQISAYQKVIDKRKEMIESAKDEFDYDADIADKVKEIADLQARIDQLSLDDSRSAKAERNSLLEQLQEKQKNLADTQRDHSVESQTSALDKMAEDYEAGKEADLDTLRKTVDLSEDLWTAFYRTLLGQSVDIGESVNANIANAWVEAARAVREYSASVESIGGIGTMVSNVPKFHSGGVVNESNIGKNEALAILQKGEIVLNDGKQETLYRIIDFQAALAKRLGASIGNLQPEIRPINVPVPTGSGAYNVASAMQNFVFEPRIEVNISHNGEMNMSDAKQYGDKIASVAIDKLYGAFERRGMNSTRGARLKP